jgi:hypothetical protein
VLLLAVAAAIAGYGLSRRGASPATTAGAGPVTVRSVSSVDPVGGSGWRRSGASLSSAVWRTQHYRGARFGGLKSGLGLLLDLGSARRVAAVRTVVGVAGTELELRAADSAAPAPGGFRLVDRQASASGQTTLRGSGGGAHRYWLVWVPRLGADGGGYSAVLRGLSVRG